MEGKVGSCSYGNCISKEVAGSCGKLGFGAFCNRYRSFLPLAMAMVMELNHVLSSPWIDIPIWCMNMIHMRVRQTEVGMLKLTSFL